MICDKIILNFTLSWLWENKSMSQKTITQCLAVIFFLLFAPCVRADVSFLLHEALGMSGESTAAGHAAVYLSNVCSEDGVSLRLCQPGEPGIVIATYPQLGANSKYEWLALPLLPYLYGVEREQDIPLYTNGEIRTLLRAKYRNQHWAHLVAEGTGEGLPPGRWQQMIGVNFNRDVYALTVKTSLAEDLKFIQAFNQRPNANRFHTLYRNCSDFTASIMNSYFPHSVHRDVLNDFTMTTPKAIAHTFTRFAQNHPERLFYVTKFAQLAGPIKRSFDNRNFSEQAFKSKKYFISSALFKQPLIPIFMGMYYLTGRYDVNKTQRQNATLKMAELKLAAKQKMPTSLQSEWAGLSTDVANSGSGISPAAALEAEQVRIFGTPEWWSKKRAAFAPLLKKAIADGYFADEKEVKSFFRDLELESEPFFDDQGLLSLKVNLYGIPAQLGLTRDNILNPSSNYALAYKLMLTKINQELTSPEKNRSTVAVFQSDWQLLLQLAEGCQSAPEWADSLANIRPRFLQHPVKPTAKQRFLKLFLKITH